MNWDLIWASAIGQLVALGIVAVAYGLVKIVTILNRIRVALASTHLVVKCEKKS